MQIATETRPAKEIARSWSEEQAKIVGTLVDKYGEPDVSGDTMLVWNERGRWKRITATKEAHKHDFPFPHTDFVENETAYKVPPSKAGDLARFDGSIIVRRTDGTIAAKCHDEEANYLAINLAHDVVTGAKSVDEARQAYLDIMIDYRAKKPTPYMEELQFPEWEDTGQRDVQMATSEQMQQEAQKRQG